MHETAFAKLNLALHVRARRPDGFHDIETLFAFTEAGDALSGAQADSLSLDVRGPFGDAAGPVASNLALRAGLALQQRFGVAQGAALILDKQLPVASGIGGGSADAAAALRLLARLWELPGDDGALHVVAASLGADVPACLASALARGEGVGTELSPVEDRSLDGMPVLLVNPGVALSTAQVFAAWDGLDRGPLAAGPALDVARAGRNDLEGAARSLVPEIDAVLAGLGRCEGLLLARMSGSGATCFGLFASDAARDAAASRIAADQTGWWQLATRLRGRREARHD